MNVAAIGTDASDPTESVAGGRPTAIGASVGPEGFAPSGASGDPGPTGRFTSSGAAVTVEESAKESRSGNGNVGSRIAEGDFRSHWEKTLAVPEPRNESTLEVEAGTKDEMIGTVPLKKRSDIARPAATNQKDAALTSGSPESINGRRPNSAGGLSKADPLSGDLWKGTVKTQSPVSRDATKTAMHTRGSLQLKNGPQTLRNASARSQASAEGVALLPSSAQMAMPPAGIQEPVRIEEFSREVQAESVSASGLRSSSDVRRGALQATDSLQSGTSAWERPIPRVENQAPASSSETSAGEASADGSTPRENAQPSDEPSETPGLTSAGAHALQAGGRATLSDAIHSSSSEAPGPTLFKRDDATDVNRSTDSAWTPAADKVALRGADGNGAILVSAGMGRAATEKPGHTGSATANLQTTHTPAAQPSRADEPAWAHFSVDGLGITNVISGHGSEVTTHNASLATVTTAADMFSALDSGASTERPGWIHAGSQRAEAGFEDPELGWVGVQADLSGGAVHAALVPGSEEAAQVLSTHLPGLSAYLSEHHAPVASLTMAAGEGSESGAGQSMQQNSDRNSGKDTWAGAQTGSKTDLSVNSDAGMARWAMECGVSPAAMIGELSGAYISVMA